MANENEKKTPFDYESEIWAVANFVWGPIKTTEFNRVILPFTMLRRLECALEPTRDAVVKAFEENKKNGAARTTIIAISARKRSTTLPLSG